MLPAIHFLVVLLFQHHPQAGLGGMSDYYSLGRAHVKVIKLNAWCYSLDWPYAVFADICRLEVLRRVFVNAPASVFQVVTLLLRGANARELSKRQFSCFLVVSWEPGLPQLLEGVFTI
jgi:hypothetical protein